MEFSIIPSLEKSSHISTLRTLFERRTVLFMRKNQPVIVLGFAWMWGINRGTAVAADTYKRRQPSSPADVVPIHLTVITTNDMHSSVQCYLLIYPITLTPCAIPNTMLTLLAFPSHPVLSLTPCWHRSPFLHTYCHAVLLCQASGRVLQRRFHTF